MMQQSTFFSVSLVLGIVSLAFAYYVGAILGLSIPYIGSNITLFWPPAGIALAVLTLWGLALCPGILLGSLVVTLTIGELALPAALGVSLGNTLGPLAGAYILRKIAGFPTHFSNKQNIIRFLIISAGTSALTASFGTLILYLNDKILIEQLQLAWLGWWSGDMIGILVFAPPFFFWSTQSIKNFLLNLTTRWEFILAISSCIGLSWIVFIGFTPLNAITSAIPYIVYLPLLWIGLRFNSMAVAIAVIVISSLATIGTSQGLGPFSEGNFYTDQFLLWVFITTTSLISFMMISIQSSRKQVEQNLRDSESRLRLALEAANQGLYDLNIQTDQAIVSPEYARMLGYDPNLFQETTEKWLERMHPEDREHTYQIYKDYINGVKSNYEVEFRQLTRAGEWKWILSLGKVVEWDDQGHPLRMLGTHTDISDFKAKELVLQQNEEALHRTQIIAKLGSWHFDLIQDVLTLSKEAFRIFGAGRQAPFSFSSFLAHVLPEDRENVNLAWQAFLKGDPYDIEFRFKLNARTKWVRVRAEITTLDSNSVPIKAVGTIQDISERKQAIEEITQAKNLLRTVIDASPDMISVKDKQHRFLLVNQSLATSQGLEPAAMLGKPDTDFWPDYQCYGDSARNIRGFHVDDNEAFSGKTVHNPADQALLANGELRWFDTIKIPLRNMQGHITAILGCARDITDRLHIESKYRALIEQIPAVTYTIAIDPEIHTVYVSPQLETQLGFSVEEWLANPQLWLNQIHPEDRKQILSSLSVSLTTGSPYYSEYRIYKKDGSLTWVRDDAVWLKDAMGKPVLLQGVMLDITHQRQAEEKLNTALEELRNSERFQRELRTLAEREQSRLGALLSAMNIGILFEDTDRRIEYINPTFTRMWNITEQVYLLNKPIQTLLERSNEIFSKPAHASKYLLNLLNSDEITKLSELELNNGRILTQSSYPVNDAEHKLIGRLWIYEDITQERQTAQQLLYLAERD
ncbi:MAG TPA: PAS domain-containing protein, partial [Nitrosomonas sp.]|nr:PAS domain-containing protein [Nitrosomonas sp.]